MGTLQTHVSQVLRSVRVKDLEHWTVCKGVYDFAGLPVREKLLLGTTGVKFLLRPNPARTKSFVVSGWQRFVRNVRINCFFTAQQKEEERRAETGGAVDRAILEGSNARREHLATLTTHQRRLYYRLGDKTWEPPVADSIVEFWLWSTASKLLATIRPYPQHVDGIRYKTNLQDTRSLRSLRARSHELHIGSPDKFAAVIVCPRTQFVQDVEAHLSLEEFYTKLEDERHQAWSIRHWLAIKTRTERALTAYLNSPHDAVEATHVRRVVKYLFRSFAATSDSFQEGVYIYNVFVPTYKIHKRPDIDTHTMQDLAKYPTGCIPLRPIISSTTDWRKPASFWIAHLLQPEVEKLWGVTSSSRKSVALYETLQVPGHALLVEFDIKDFFLNIDPQYCYNVLAKFLAERVVMPRFMKDAALAVLRHLLTHNYFTFDGKRYKQKKGIGIGIDCASQVAAVVAYHYEASKNVHLQTHLLGWQRYLDDGCFAWRGNVAELHAFFADLNAGVSDTYGNCRFQYIYKFDDKKMVFTDILLFKGVRWARNGVLDVKLYEKPQNPHAYLPWHSCHRLAVHRGWIKQELQRRVANHSANTDYVHSAAKFIQDLINRGFCGTFLRDIAKDVTFAERPQLLGHRRADRDACRMLPVVLPYHPQLIGRFRETIAIPDRVAPHLAPGTRLLFSYANADALLGALRSRRDRSAPVHS